MALYVAMNAVVPTSAAPVKVSTGTSIITMLQVATPSGKGISIVEWGCSFDGAAPAQAIECELFNSTSHITTGNSLTPSGYDADGQNYTSVCVGGASTGTAYWKTGQTEGAGAAYIPFDIQLVDPAIGYVKQFPLGVQPYAGKSTFTSIRMTAAAAVNAYCYIIWEE